MPRTVFTCRERLWAAAFIAVFVLAMVINGLSSSGIGVPLTNKQISDAHPVYLTPASFAFAVWGISARTHAPRSPGRALAAVFGN